MHSILTDTVVPELKIHEYYLLQINDIIQQFKTAVLGRYFGRRYFSLSLSTISLKEKALHLFRLIICSENCSFNNQTKCTYSRLT